MIRQVLFFGIAGGIGFVIDAGGVYIFSHILELHPLIARIPAFVAAVIATFLINHRLTFAGALDGGITQAFMKYISANILAQGLNLGIYTALIYAHPFFFTNPVTAVAIGSLSVMALSFTLSKFWVFGNTDKDI